MNIKMHKHDLLWTMAGFTCLFAPGVIAICIYRQDTGHIMTIYAIIVALYTAFYGMCWAQFEYHNNRQRQQLSIIAALMATEYRMDFVQQLAVLTQEKAPIRPTWFSFRQIAYSSFRRYDEGNPFLDYNKALISDAAALIRGFMDWRGANFQKGILVHANLKFANLSFTDITDAKLDYADLKYVNLDNTLIYASSFNRANLQYANVRNSRAHSTEWRYARLEGTDFSNSDLKGACCTGASIGYNRDDELLHTCFENTTLSFVDMNPVRVWAPGGYGMVGDDCTNKVLIDYLATLLQYADTLFEAKIPLPVKKVLQQFRPHLFLEPSDSFKTAVDSQRPNTPEEEARGKISLIRDAQRRLKNQKNQENHFNSSKNKEDEDD